MDAQVQLTVSGRVTLREDFSGGTQERRYFAVISTPDVRAMGQINYSSPKIAEIAVPITKPQYEQLKKDLESNGQRRSRPILSLSGRLTIAPEFPNS